VLSAFFIRRPIFAAVVSIFIVIVGLVALVALPVARYPAIAPPTIVVTAMYPGATAETIAETVATPIEQEVNGVEGMLYMSSASSSDGTMQLTITFEVGTDLDMANVLVQNRVALAEPKLPEEVRRLGITVRKRSTDFLFFICLASPGAQYDELFLTNYANLYLRDELARIDGVGEVMLFGPKYGMRIWLDPDRLRALDLTTDEVVQAIREQNVQVSAGSLGEPPAPAGTAFQLTVSTLGRLSEPEQFENIVVKTGAAGQLTRVGDVATVELGAESYALASYFGGEPAAVLAIYQLPGANAVATADAVRSRLASLADSDERFGQGLEYTIVYDGTDVIRASIAEVVVTLFITVILVVATVYVFLQDWRATLVPAVTIPVSLIGTFAVLAGLGYSLNILTLFGLVLVIGIVVDDAIVVVENTSRIIAEGTPPREAAVKSMQEVTGPVIATTLVLLAVFVPTIFMGGITGRLFRQFAVTISIATLFSSINALTLSPALCALLLRRQTGRALAPFRLFNWLLARTTTAYTGTVRLALKVAVVGIVGYGAVVAVAIWSLGRLPTGFVPQEDEGLAFISIQLPDGASLERTHAVTQRITERVAPIAGVEHVVMIDGFSIVGGSRASNTASGIVALASWDERPGVELSQDAIVRQINAAIAPIQEAQCVAFQKPSLDGVGVSGGFMFRLQDRADAGPAMLETVANDLVATANGQAGLARVFTTFRANVPQLFLDLDREQVKALGIPLQSVFNTLSAYLGSVYVNDFTRFGRSFQVKVQAEPEFRVAPGDIQRLEVRAPGGGMVPLGSLLTVEETLGPQTVEHFNIYPSARINGQPAPGFSSGQALEIIEEMAANTLPPTMGFAWSDLSYQEVNTGSVAPIFIFAVVMVFLVLAAQYESWSLPWGIVLAVPTALLGAVVGILLRGFDFNVYTQIGIVLLIGLSAKTAILIVEFAKVQREEGHPAFDAAVAAARLRFRAVLMTAFSFVLGVIPLVIATGAGAASRQVLGTVVLAGMLVATIAGVVAVPLLYFVIQRLTEMVFRRNHEPEAGAATQPSSSAPSP
jgi:hydrophobic/amphiphilic exporter-1 (mainly G- bacteria), HAE1 family